MMTFDNQTCRNCDERLPKEATSPSAREVWDEGYTRGFYDREKLTGDSRDASEGSSENPYAAGEDSERHHVRSEPMTDELITDAMVEAATVASINAGLAPYGEAITATTDLQGGVEAKAEMRAALEAVAPAIAAALGVAP